MKSTTAQTPPTWQSLRIPAVLEIVGRPTIRNLSLRLASESDRRTWELYFDAAWTPRTLFAFLFVLPWKFDDERRMDLSAAHATATRMIHSRALVWAGDHFLTIQGFHHEEGTEALQAMLQAVDSHFEAAAAGDG